METFDSRLEIIIETLQFDISAVRNAPKMSFGYNLIKINNEITAIVSVKTEGKKLRIENSTDKKQSMANNKLNNDV